MKICVLGGSGFIGTNLVTGLLKQGHDVVIGDLRTSEKFPELCQTCDVQVLDEVRAAIKGCDVVYNLAAEHKDNVRPIKKYYDVNVDAAETVCEACTLESVKRIIFTSSVAVYGITEEELDETGATNPFNHYGKSKLEAEAKYQKWNEASSENVLTIIRPTVVFGEHNRGNFFNLLNQVVSGKFIMIGNGKNKKSVAYVENIAAFLAHVLTVENPEEIYNYIDKPDMDMNDLVIHLRKTMGKPGKIGLRIPYWFGYSAGKALDGIGFCLKREFPISAVRVQKFCSNSCFAADRVAASGFIAPYSLQTAIVNTIKSEWPELGVKE